MSLDLGKSGSYMRSISIGKALPSMHEFLRICEYLGVTSQEFFTGAGDETDRINIFNRLQDLDGRKVNPLSARQVFACRAFSFCGTYLVERRIAWQMCLTLR